MNDYKVTMTIQLSNDLPIGLVRVFSSTNPANAIKQAMAYWGKTYKTMNDSNILSAEAEKLN